MLKMKTEVLSDIVAKLGSLKENRLLLITSYWNIVADADGYEFKAYDGSTYIKIYGDTAGDLDVIVKADQFGKLVNKTTSEFMQLEMNENNLRVIGNGEYLVEIISEDEVYPDFEEALEEIELPESFIVDPVMFNEILNINDSAVSKGTSDGVLQGYYFDNGTVITTDSFKVCVNPATEPIADKPILVERKLLDAIGAITSDECDVTLLPDNRILVEGDGITIFSKLFDGEEEYPDVTSISEMEYEFSVTLPTQTVKSILDRLSLFISNYDNNIVEFEFGPEVLTVKTQGKSKEKVRYMGDKNKAGKFVCNLNSQLLKDLLSSVTADKFVIEYGNDSLISIKTQGVDYYLALAEED